MDKGRVFWYNKYYSGTTVTPQLPHHILPFVDSNGVCHILDLFYGSTLHYLYIMLISGTVIRDAVALVSNLM